MKERKVSIWSSIKTKIVLCVVVAIIATVAINCLITIPDSRNKTKALIQNYMNDLTRNTGKNLDRQVTMRGITTVMRPLNLAAELRNCKITDMDSSYAYLVDLDGTVLYHPTTEKIGQPVENEAVKQILSRISAGEHPETEIVEYEFDGVAQYASFYYGEANGYILIITADEEEALKSVNEMVRSNIIIGVLSILVCGVIGFFIALLIVKPIIATTHIIAKLAELDFTKPEGEEQVGRRRDETGLMLNSVDVLREHLVEVVEEINLKSENVQHASQLMDESASETLTAVGQVEDAVHEIAEGATAQAQDTQVAAENVLVMGQLVEETNHETEALNRNAREMDRAGKEAFQILEKLGEANQKSKKAIKIIADQTDATNDAANQIKTAIDIIMNIAEETSLLSLNASIEAARAGEQGRGFAVVASQIQKLAEQSNASASQITEIVNLLILKSEQSVRTMNEVQEVIEEQNEFVAQTESAFKDVKTGIDSSIRSVREISEKSEQLAKARVNIEDVVQNLTAIAQENAASAEETSASATEVGATMDNISENAKNLNQIAEDLMGSVARFKL